MPDMGEPKSPVQAKAEVHTEWRCRTKSRKAPKTSPRPWSRTRPSSTPPTKPPSQIREQVALETLDELLDYILLQNGSVGILDATNSHAGPQEAGHESDSGAARGRI